MEEAWELAAVRTGRLALMVLTAALCSGCGNANQRVKVFDATSDAKLSQSRLAIEKNMTQDEKDQLEQAINVVTMLPESGSCDDKDILAHFSNFEDPKYRQAIYLALLHGLTAQQVTTMSKTQSCETAINDRVQ